MTDKDVTNDGNFTSMSAPAFTDRLLVVDDGTTALQDITLGVLGNYVIGLEGPPQGGLLNGYISRTVASNNLTVAVKTLAGGDPSATDPVYVRIGNTVRKLTAALSVTKNAGTNWCNAGGSELATKEIDYFVVMGYNATDGTVIGFTRYLPANLVYGSWSATSTAESYAAISTITNAAATDEYEVVGRFNATLSAGAGYTWSVPATSIVISRPIFETRWLSWAPVYSCSGSLTYSGSAVYAFYKITPGTLTFEQKSTGTLGGSASNLIYVTVPFDAAQSANSPTVGSVAHTGSIAGALYLTAGTPDKLTIAKYDASNYATTGTWLIGTLGSYDI